MRNQLDRKIFQPYRILRPKTVQVFPIPCDEWENLKVQLGRISEPPWLYQQIGFLLFGISLTTVVGIVIDPLEEKQMIIGWGVAIVTFIWGLACVFIDRQQHRSRRIAIGNVVEQMKLIQARYKTHCTAERATPRNNLFS